MKREYPVGATLAWIGDAGEVLPDRADDTTAAPVAVSDEQRVTAVARRLAERHGVDAARLEGTRPGAFFGLRCLEWRHPAIPRPSESVRSSFSGISTGASRSSVAVGR